MYTKEQLKRMTEEAKQKLSEQDTEQEVDGDVDYYADYRDEIEEIASENKIEDKDKVEEEHIKLKYQAQEIDQRDKLSYEMTSEEYQSNQEIMEQSIIENEDEFIFPGGPTKLDLDGWKNKFKDAVIYITEVCDQMFVFRTLNRFEYKQLVRQPNLDASIREEVICETTVLFPYDYDWSVMAKKEAGIPSTLSQIIMKKSGFTDEYFIERL